MHASARQKMDRFVAWAIDDRRRPDRVLTVLDVGSSAKHEQDSHRSLVEGRGAAYVGLDIAPGANVDLVPEDPYAWDEIESETIDICISGQMFEHNPFFWLTAAEIARVLRPEGLAMVIAPGRGAVHRYPLDCYRFFPDSWQAICSYVGLDVVEDHFEEYRALSTVDGASWSDSCVIARKPLLAPGNRAEFYDRLTAIRGTRPLRASELRAKGPGPVLDGYRRQVEQSRLRALTTKARRINTNRIKRMVVAAVREA